MNAIYKFVLGMIGKRSGVVTTLPSKKQVEFQANMLAEKFMQNGIDPNALKSPEQVKNVLANIDQANMRVIPADSSEGRGITKALGIGKKADVMDMKGNKINTSKGIMGGEEIKTSTSDADMIIKNIKSMEPMDAMKEANSVIGRKGKYKNLTEEQSKKILKDTEDHIFERDIPEDPEDFAIGGRVGLKGGAFLNFIKNLGKGMNNKSPLQAYKDYLKSVKERTLKANETGKFTDLPLETIPVAASGGLLTSYLKKKMKAMDEEQKAKVEKKADGGRIGFFTGMRAQEQKQKSSTNREKGIMSRGLGPKGTTGDITEFKETPVERPDNRPDNRPTVLAPPSMGFGNPPPKPEVKKNISTGSFTPTFNFLKKFAAHDRFTDNLKARRGKNYHELGGLDFMARFPDINPSIAKGLASAYQTIIEGGRAIADGSGGYTLENANKRAKEEARLNAVGIDAFANPDSSLYQEYTDMVPESGAVQMADGGRIGYKAGSVDKMRRLILKTIGAGTAGIAGAKSGIFSFGKGPAKEVAKEVVKQSAGTPPPYFFKLAEKIKMMGDDATATTDRTIAKTLKSKDGKSTYVLEEDLTSGDTIIKKINKEGDEMITDVQIMELRKGEIVQTKDGKALKTPDEYEEVTEANARIEGDTFNDPYYSDGIEEIEMKKIIDEVDDTTPSINYA
jgi:hypothetical protein